MLLTFNSTFNFIRTISSMLNFYKKCCDGAWHIKIGFLVNAIISHYTFKADRFHKIHKILFWVFIFEKKLKISKDN